MVKYDNPPCALNYDLVEDGPDQAPESALFLSLRDFFFLSEPIPTRWTTPIQNYVTVRVDSPRDAPTAPADEHGAGREGGGGGLAGQHDFPSLFPTSLPM